jgi:hypothetical protein
MLKEFTEKKLRRPRSFDEIVNPGEIIRCKYDTIVSSTGHHQNGDIIRGVASILAIDPDSAQVAIDRVNDSATL